MFENIVLTGFADEIAASLDVQMQVLEKLHMHHIEMRGVDGRNFVEYSADQAREIKRRLEDKGFALSAVGSPIGKIGIKEDFAPIWSCSGTRWSWLISWVLRIFGCSVFMVRGRRSPLRTIGKR